MFVRSRLLRRLLEPDLTQVVARRIDAHDVTLATGATIEEVGGKRKVEYVLIEGQKLPADIVVFTRGAKPNVSLAVRTGLQLAQN
ncbi:MAG: FAD-dependent oxidoreductase [Candidatus Korarchaeota archaeon]|nr:FAD-dependent oxidoreductase [Candidatus Korarchaeota archaeon]